MDGIMMRFTRKRHGGCVLSVITLCLFMQIAQAANPNLPRNVFANDPISSYWVWWRPQKVIFDPSKVLEIQRQIAAIDLNKVTSVNLDDAFGEHGSAFLFPILATHGNKGTILLSRFLKPYVEGRALDDSWLLIVASLGRISSPEAQSALEGELARMLKEWARSETIKAKGKEIHAPRPDARLPPLDALLACLASQKVLTAQKIDALCKQVRDRILVSHSWRAGLEWAQQLVPEEALLILIDDALALCDEEELRAAMELQVSSDRLRMIRDFLLGSTDTWPIVEKLLLRHASSEPEIFDYLLIQYMCVLSNEAQISHGTYALNEQVLSLLSRRDVGSHASLSYISRVLSGCKTLGDYPQWDQFLARHAATLDKYEDAAAFQVKRILESKDEETKQLFDKQARVKVYENFRAPGVYMIGFTGARRQLGRE